MYPVAAALILWIAVWLRSAQGKKKGDHSDVLGWLPQARIGIPVGEEIKNKTEQNYLPKV